MLSCLKLKELCMSFIASVTDESVDLSSFIPVIKVIGVGGAGGNAIANIMSLEGVQCVIANTDAQSLVLSPCKNRIQLGRTLTAGLGAGALPEIGKKAALESKDEIMEFLKGTNMVFITAGMGGGTGTGAAPVIAQIAREMGILTVAVVTKPFNFEGHHRIELAEQGVQELEKHVDTIIVVANQKLFRVSNENTTFTDAFRMADEVLYGGVKCITDLITMPGLINLDFADIRTVMSNMGYAMMGSSEASGEGRATTAIEMAITNPLLENVSLEGAKGILVNITGGPDMTLFEVNDVVAKIQERIDRSTRLIFGAIFDQNMEGKISVAVVATGVNSIDKKESQSAKIISHIKEETVQPIEKSMPANRPPYMKNIPVKNEEQVKYEPALSYIEHEDAFNFYPETENKEEYKANIQAGNKFNQDIENEIIGAIGGDEFLAQESISMNKKTFMEMAREKEIDQAKHNILDFEINNSNKIVRQNKPDSVQPIIPIKLNVETEEEDKPILRKNTSIFARMANIIKDKKVDYEVPNQKKNIEIENIDLDNKIKNTQYQSADLYKDLPSKPTFSGSFFSIIESDNIKQ